MKIYGQSAAPRIYVHAGATTRPVTILVGSMKMACSVAEARLLATSLAEAADEAAAITQHQDRP